MLILGGASAVSSFRLEKLTLDAAGRGHQIKSLRAFFFYLADTNGELSPNDKARLQNLVDGTQECTEDVVAAAGALLVVPRWGTRSPWSTKASEIAKRCSLSGLRRLERGVAWHFDDMSHDVKARKYLAQLVHDPMIESIASDPAKLAQTFYTAAAGPLGFVDVRDGGTAALEDANRREGFALNHDEIAYLVE